MNDSYQQIGGSFCTVWRSQARRRGF